MRYLQEKIKPDRIYPGETKTKDDFTGKAGCSGFFCLSPALRDRLQKCKKYYPSTKYTYS